MKPRFPNTRTADLQVVREDVNALARELGESAGGKLLGDVEIGTSETPVAHGLNQTPTGWRPYNVQGDARIWQTQPAGRVFLYLQASAAVTAGIEVF